MTEDDGLDCLDLLEETPDRFSVAEVLAHLSHSEGHCYRMRVDRFLGEEMPEFEPDDAQMYRRSIAAPTPKTRSTISKSSARAMWSICAVCRGARANGGRGTKRPAKSRCSRCCTSGPCTIWGTFARSPSRCARESTGRPRESWGRAISCGRNSGGYRLVKGRSAASLISTARGPWRI
jgi:hypothetical protein